MDYFPSNQQIQNDDIVFQFIPIVLT